MKEIKKEYVISLGMFNVLMHKCLRNAYEDIVWIGKGNGDMNLCM